MTEPVVSPTALPSTDLEAIASTAKSYAEQSLSTATRRAYGTAWADFERWCQQQDFSPLPAAEPTVGLYLADRAATLTVATLNLRLSAIRARHRLAGHPLNGAHPAIRDVFVGIKRVKGSAPQAKAPLLTEQLRAAVLALPETVKGHRDRALLLLGFAAALRRAELVSLDVGDISFVDDGLILLLRRRKTDQEGEGTRIGVAHGANPLTCPVRAVSQWIAVGNVESGPLFRPVTKGGAVSVRRLSDRTVARLVKAAAAAIGADPNEFAGHSLRAGLATSAARAGAEERHIMRQTGHRSVQTVRRYIREGELFRDNVSSRVGL